MMIFLVFFAVAVIIIFFFVDFIFFGIDHGNFLFGISHRSAGIIQLHHHFLGKQIAVDDPAAPFFTFAAVTTPGHTFFQFKIAFVFIFQTAFQSAADPGNGAWREGKILFFCHFHIDGRKIFEENTAAQRSAANGNTADDRSFIPHPDLTQFDPGIEFL